jgi:hypothetical protein
LRPGAASHFYVTLQVKDMDDPTAVLRMWEMARRPELHPGMRRHFGRQLRRHRGNEDARRHIRRLWRQWRHMCRRFGGGGGTVVEEIQKLITALESMQKKVTAEEKAELLKGETLPPSFDGKFIAADAVHKLLSEGGGGGGLLSHNGQKYFPFTQKGEKLAFELDKETIKQTELTVYKVTDGGKVSEQLSDRTLYLRDVFGSNNLCVTELGGAKVDADKLCFDWTDFKRRALLPQADFTTLLTELQDQEDYHKTKLYHILNDGNVRKKAAHLTDKKTYDDDWGALIETWNQQYKEFETQMEVLRANPACLSLLAKMKDDLKVTSCVQKVSKLPTLGEHVEATYSYEEDLTGSVRIYGIMNDYQFIKHRIFDLVRREKLLQANQNTDSTTALARYCSSENPSPENPSSQTFLEKMFRNSPAYFQKFHHLFDTQYAFGDTKMGNVETLRTAAAPSEESKVWTSPAHWYLGEIPFGLKLGMPDGKYLKLQSPSGSTTTLEDKHEWKTKRYNTSAGKVSIKSVCDMVQTGRSVVVMASGYSGSGKTYILTGDEEDPNATGLGIMQLALLNMPAEYAVTLDTVVELYGGINPYFTPPTDNTKTAEGAAAAAAAAAAGNTPSDVSRSTMSYIFYTVGEHKGTIQIKLEEWATKGNSKQCITEIPLQIATTSMGSKEELKNVVIEVTKIRKEQQRVRSTPNNKDSSRGHTFYSFEVKKKGNSAGYFTVCDMAGLENPNTMIGKYLSFYKKDGTDADIPPHEKMAKFMKLYQAVMGLDVCKTLPYMQSEADLYYRHCWASLPVQQAVDQMNKQLCLNAIFTYPTDNLASGASKPRTNYVTDVVVMDTNKFAGQDLKLDMSKVWSKIRDLHINPETAGDGEDQGLRALVHHYQSIQCRYQHFPSEDPKDYVSKYEGSMVISKGRLAHTKYRYFQRHPVGKFVPYTGDQPWLITSSPPVFSHPYDIIKGKVFIAMDKLLGEVPDNNFVYMCLNLSAFQNSDDLIKATEDYVWTVPYPASPGIQQKITYHVVESEDKLRELELNPDKDMKVTQNMIQKWISSIYKLVSEAFWINETLNHIQAVVSVLSGNQITQTKWETCGAQYESSKFIYTVPTAGAIGDMVNPKNNNPALELMADTPRWNIIYISNAVQYVTHIDKSKLTRNTVYKINVYDSILNQIISLVCTAECDNPISLSQDPKLSNARKALERVKSASSWAAEHQIRQTIHITSNLGKPIKVIADWTLTSPQKMIMQITKEEEGVLEQVREKVNLDLKNHNIFESYQSRTDSMECSVPWNASTSAGQTNNSKIPDPGEIPHLICPARSILGLCVIDSKYQLQDYETKCNLLFTTALAQILNVLIQNAGSGTLANSTAQSDKDKVKVQNAKDHLDMLHSGQLLPVDITATEQVTSIPMVGVIPLMQSILSDTRADKACPFGKPKMVMLFIMRPTLCEDECSTSGAVSADDKRFCDGTVATLQTAIRISGVDPKSPTDSDYVCAAYKGQHMASAAAPKPAASAPKSAASAASAAVAVAAPKPAPAVPAPPASAPPAVAAADPWEAAGWEKDDSGDWTFPARSDSSGYVWYISISKDGGADYLTEPHVIWKGIISKPHKIQTITDEIEKVHIDEDLAGHGKSLLTQLEGTSIIRGSIQEEAEA